MTSISIKPDFPSSSTLSSSSSSSSMMLEPVALPSKAGKKTKHAKMITPNSMWKMTAIARDKINNAPFLADYRTDRDVLNGAIEKFNQKMSVYKQYTNTPASISSNQLVIKHLRIQLEEELGFIDEKSTELAQKINTYLEKNKPWLTNEFDGEFTEIMEKIEERSGSIKSAFNKATYNTEEDSDVSDISDVSGSDDDAMVDTVEGSAPDFNTVKGAELVLAFNEALTELVRKGINNEGKAALLQRKEAIVSFRQELKLATEPQDKLLAKLEKTLLDINDKIENLPHMRFQFQVDAIQAKLDAFIEKVESMQQDGLDDLRKAKKSLDKDPIDLIRTEVLKTLAYAGNHLPAIVNQSEAVLHTSWHSIISCQEHRGVPSSVVADAKKSLDADLSRIKALAKIALINIQLETKKMEELIVAKKNEIREPAPAAPNLSGNKRKRDDQEFSTEKELGSSTPVDQKASVKKDPESSPSALKKIKAWQPTT